eukprot:4998690-Amphidinium_carterae.1
MQGNGVIDTKALTKPPKFDGAESHWKDWSFQFEAYIGLLGQDLLTPLIECRGRRGNVRPLAELDAATAQHS